MNDSCNNNRMSINYQVKTSICGDLKRAICILKTSLDSSSCLLYIQQIAFKQFLTYECQSLALKT